MGECVLMHLLIVFINYVLSSLLAKPQIEKNTVFTNGDSIHSTDCYYLILHSLVKQPRVTR